MFWHITSVLKTGGWSIAREDKIASCETVQPSPGVPCAIASQSSTAQPSSALHSKIAGVVFGSSTEASARCLSWLSRAD
jgi:hypothetical protein